MRIGSWLCISLLLASCHPSTVPEIYTLSTSVNPPDSGSINLSGGEYKAGSTITLSARANQNYVFSSWSGDANGDENPLSFEMNVNKNIIANFIGADTDGDGVTDDIDQDNGTRSGAPVDENGVMLNPLYLDENGVTIKAQDWAFVGDRGELNGEEYTIVSRAQLRSLVVSGDDVTRVCTSRLVQLNGMFREATQFNQNIQSWDTSSVTNMSAMFENASAFNQDISYWNTSNVTDMEIMFSGASAFNQDLSRWSVSRVINCSDALNSTSNWTLPKPNFTHCSP